MSAWLIVGPRSRLKEANTHQEVLLHRQQKYVVGNGPMGKSKEEKLNFFQQRLFRWANCKT
jgi:hypothetical protein